MLALKIVSWYLVIGTMFIFAMARNIDLIVAALRMTYQDDPKKQLSEKEWKKFILVIFVLFWPLFVYNILKRIGKD